MKQRIKKVPIPGNFYADEFGIIYEFKNKIMIPCLIETMKGGYLCLNRKIYGGLKFVHRLVALTFHGDISGKQVDHINRKTWDNRINNLQILSKELHLRKTRCKGSDNNLYTYTNRLTLQDKDEILILLKNYNVEQISQTMCLSLFCVKSVEQEYKKMSCKSKRRLYLKVKKNKSLQKRIKSLLKILKNNKLKGIMND